MKTINLSPYNAQATEKGSVSSAPTHGDIAECIQEYLERAVGVDPDGRLTEDAVYILSRFLYESEIRWHLRLCRDTRNVRDVAGELAWAPIDLIERILAELDRMIFIRRP